MKSVFCLIGCVLFLVGCAAPPVQIPEVEPQYWSISRTVNSELGMVTLHDPADLSHHEIDPEDWYRYDFAFNNDLETGRFAAALTDKTGKLDVRLTTGPLTANELNAAGPNAQVRLRVIDHRLLLSGGNTWPSVKKTAQSFAYDQRWINFENGDYNVTITVLDPQLGAEHDIVFQLTPVNDIQSIAYAPGIPYLVVGKQAAVTGINAGALSYHEQCTDVPPIAAWAALTSDTLPVPGSVASINLPKEFHTRGRTMQAANINAAVPIVVARRPVPGAIGLYLAPDSWRSDVIEFNGEVPITTRILCAVKIVDIVSESDNFALKIEAAPGARDSLDSALVLKLNERFENWLRLSGDPAWRFKSTRIQRTHDSRSKLLGILNFLELNAKHSESLLLETNAVLASRLIEHLTIDFAEANN